MTAADKFPHNVASLHEKRSEKKRATQATALMAHCRDQLREHMRTMLPWVMDQVDDALFDLADRADTNQLQSAYFEAMRSVRLGRERILARFAAELETAIGRKLRPAAPPCGRTGLPEVDPQKFALVDQDDLEETVAAKNIAGKIRNLCHEELFALDRRVALLLSDPELEGEDNPLGPEVLCNATRAAVDEIEANVEVRLLVLKLFDRHLTRAAEQVYPEINAWLVKQGVLPTVRASVGARTSRPHGQSARRAPRASTGPRAASCDPAPESGAGDAALEGVTRYHPHAGAAETGASSTQGRRSGNGAAPGAGGPRGEQLLGFLDQIMRVGGADALDGADAAPSRARFIGDLTALQHDPEMVCAGTANVVRELKASGATRGISHVDGLMIDVVAMMFDFILADENIGDAMRALIARLQIPVLKVAVLDKSFFARRSHPARSFINTLAELGTRWGGGRQSAEHEPVFERVRELVTRILDEFEAELDVFSAALEELKSILAHEEDAAQENAWSSAKIAEERERLMDARRHAEQEVGDRLRGSSAPSEVADFLRAHWRHLLGERLFREGEEGEGWRAGVQTMDQLLWSVARKGEASDRERLLGMLPFLLERLKDGMRELCLPQESRVAFLSALSGLHIAALKGGDSQAVPAASAPVRAQPENVTAPVPLAEQSPRGDELVRGAVDRANALVWATAEERPQCKGMGSTVVAVKLDGNRLVCAHVGDSRLYRLRAGKLSQLTRDHTYRQEMVDRGLATKEEASAIAGNLITRAVGGDASVLVDVGVHDVQCDDLYLACSDGLTDMLDDARIARLLREVDHALDFDTRANVLVDAANAAGGLDNVSVALLRVDVEPPPGDAGAVRDYEAFVRVAAASHTGYRRSHNEDAVEVDARSGALVLADGMGGHNAGEVASAMTVKVVMDALRDAASWVVNGMPPSPGEQSAQAAADATFDFESISAAFWDKQLPSVDNTALYEAVAAEVEHVVLSSDDDLFSCFDIDGETDDAPGTDASGAALDAARDPLLERVLRLGCGTWVEFGDTAGRGLRARLSWIAPDRAYFLFTNRMGEKVTQSTPHGLAVELRLGRMRLLDSVPLLDRAVSSLAQRLRPSARATAVH